MSRFARPAPGNGVRTTPACRAMWTTSLRKSRCLSLAADAVDRANFNPSETIHAFRLLSSWWSRLRSLAEVGTVLLKSFGEAAHSIITEDHDRQRVGRCRHNCDSERQSFPGCFLQKDDCEQSPSEVSVAQAGSAIRTGKPDS